MSTSKIIAMAIGFALPLSCAAAQSVPRQQSAAQTYMLKGACNRLVVRGATVRDCQGALMNTVWPDSRSGFYFVTKDGLALTFSGMGSSQVHPDDNTAVQGIDRIIIGRPPEMPEHFRAVGMCRFANPTRGGSVPVSCAADTDQGRFEGEFRSDGNPPATATLPAPSMDEVKALYERMRK